MAHELHKWWGTRRWIIQMLVWIALVNVCSALLQTTKDVKGLAEMIFQMGVVLTMAGVVISAQGVIIQEKQMGTTAWILSKPVARSAFILAKLLGHAAGFLVLAVVIPLIGFEIQLYLMYGRMLPLPGVLAAAGVWVIGVLFYLSMTIMLGTIFRSRGAVLGIPMLFLVAGGSIVAGLVPAVTMIMPWALAAIAMVLALGPEAPGSIPLAMTVIPVVATALWTAVFTAVAIWRFGKDEF
jgi:ABC-2 type transport system permease protein